MAVPKPPTELKTSGKRLWRAILGEYELEAHESGLLLEMCRTADQLDALAALVDRDGVTIIDDKGNVRAHPALVESRQQKIAYARLTAALRLPAGEEGDLRRPQRRVGARGVYGITGAVA